MKSETFRRLAALGLSHEQMAGVLEAFEIENSERDNADEERKAKGRERWRRWKESNGANVSKREQTLANGSCGGDARGDVKQNNLEIPNPKKDNSSAKPRSDVQAFKAELASFLSEERVDAIVDQRRKKKAPITEHSGRLLAKALKSCGDVNYAADEMVLRNWTSVKPEWLSTGNQRGQPPPRRESDFARHQRECTEALERNVYGNRDHEQPASNGPAFDLEPGNWRSH